MTAATGIHRHQKIGKKRDWSLVISGVLVFLMGLVVMAWPGLSLVTIAIMAGVILIASGIGGIVSYAGLRNVVPGAGWVLANAICDLLLGILFVVFPAATAAMLPWMAGVFVICYSIYAIIAGVAMRQVFSSWGLMVATGIIGLICGIMFMTNPGFFVIFLGIFLMMRGITLAVDGIVCPKDAYL